MPSSEPPLSVSTAAKQSGIPRRTIQWALKRGDLRAHKMDGETGAYLIEADDFAEWVQQRQAQAS